MKLSAIHSVKLIRNTLLVAAIISAPSSFAQTVKKAPTKKPVASWVVNCSPTATGESMFCQMSQTFTESKSKKRIMAISIRPQPSDKAKRPLMVLALPHGLYFPAGVNFKIDKQSPVPVQLRTSDPNGVYSTTPLGPKIIAAMKKGDTLTITMYAAANKPLAIPVSLVGFSAAFKKVNSSN